MADSYDSLKLDNQLCFPLYAAAKEIVRRYTPYLDELDLTYTQYITMMLLWEHESLLSKEIGKRLYLDSGTLTPVLKKLEDKDYVTRSRLKDDERNVVVSLTPRGMALREEALSVPPKVGVCVGLESDDAMTLYKLLYRLLDNLTGQNA